MNTLIANQPIKLPASSGWTLLPTVKRGRPTVYAESPVEQPAANKYIERIYNPAISNASLQAILNSSNYKIVRMK